MARLTCTNAALRGSFGRSGPNRASEARGRAGFGDRTPGAGPDLGALYMHQANPKAGPRGPGAGPVLGGPGLGRPSGTGPRGPALGGPS